MKKKRKTMNTVRARMPLKMRREADVSPNISTTELTMPVGLMYKMMICAVVRKQLLWSANPNWLINFRLVYRLLQKNTMLPILKSRMSKSRRDKISCSLASLRFYNFSRHSSTPRTLQTSSSSNWLIK